jgi:hypothetical protein
MKAIRVRQIAEKEGEIHLTGLPCKKGQEVKVLALIDQSSVVPHQRLTADNLLQSGLVGLWEDHDDIDDSASYARRLREQAHQP